MPKKTATKNATSGTVHFLQFWEDLRSSKIQKNCKNSRENAKKCKRKAAKKNAHSGIVPFFAFFGGPPVRAPKVQKIVSMSTKEKASRVEKKL